MGVLRLLTALACITLGACVSLKMDGKTYDLTANGLRDKDGEAFSLERHRAIKTEERAFYNAVWQGDLTLARELYNPKLRTFLEYENGYSLAHLAVLSKKPEVLEFVLAKGADPNYCGSARLCPIHSAALSPFYGEKLLEVLVKHPEIKPDIIADHKFPHRNTALLDACRWGSDRGIQHLLNAGANPNIKNPASETPVYVATEYRSISVLEAMLEANADPNTLSPRGRQSLLHLASCNGDKEKVMLLIEAGADPDTYNGEGETPLTLAVYSRNQELVRYFKQVLKK